MTEMEILSIEGEPPRNGNVLLKITVESEGKEYVIGAKEEDYLNEHTRAQIHKMLLKRIEKDQAPKPKNAKDPKDVYESLRGTIVKTNER